MPPPRDPDEVEQTLLPGSASEPAHPAKPPAGTETPPVPAPADATVDVPISVALPPTPPSAEETLPSVGPSVAAAGKPPASIGRETNSEFEATLLPGPHSTNGTGTVADASPGAAASDAGATLPVPTGLASSGGSRGPLGSDTSPLSMSAAPGPKLGPSPSSSGTMVGRFALRSLHATGGLGEVFTARDTELNREVAVKRIKSRYADDEGSRRRFLTEAELTAKLDHPGVVPVFGLVNDARGRPCYAMRFIRGETLKDEIERYHGILKPEAKANADKAPETVKTEAPEAKPESKPEEKKPPTPGSATTPEGSPTGTSRSVAFRQLLSRFMATCQAIAYAHSRNIIHRDIKPANVMVGTFGETLVVDWGLAKSLDDGPDFDRVMKAQAEAGFRHDPELTDIPTHVTMAGTAVGTPAYMAPEQAAGELDKVGPRADVYALGATLYVILTGKAPFGGKTTNEVLDAVRRGAYEPAATVNPECPKPLDAIARKAMALRQEDRYSNALELAADVERWLSDEPVSCYEDPWYAKLARWARRNPARVATAVSLLLAGVIGVAGVAWAIHLGEKKTAAERDRVAAQEKKTGEALAQVTEEQGRTKKALTQVTAEQANTEEQRKLAVGARNVATKRYEKAVEAYNTLVYDIDKQLADRAGMQDLRKKLLLSATDGLQQLIEGGGEGQGGADRTLVAAYRQMGELYQLLGDTATARKHFAKAVMLATQVQRDSQTAADKRAANRDLGRCYDKLAGIHQKAGDTRAALDAVESAIKLFADLAEDQTDAEAQKDLAAAKERRAKIRLERGETGKALEDCKDSLAIRQRLADGAPDDLERKRALASGLDTLAGLQLRTGRTAEATTNAQKSLTILAAVAAKQPDQPDVQRELADARSRLGEVHFERAQMTAAAKEFSAGLELLKLLAKKDPKSVSAKGELALTYGRLGHAQLRTGDVEEAVANTKAGKELALELQQADPDSAQAERDLALARERYGDALLAIGRINDGIAEYAASEKSLRPLRAADKDSAQAKIELARGLERLGDGYLAKGDMPNAIAAFKESVAIRKEVRAKDDNSASAKRDLATGLYKLATAYCNSGKPGLAEGDAKDATDLFVALAAADPDSAQAQRDIALAYGKWGQILATGGHVTGALIVWQSSLDRCEKLAKVDAGNAQAKEDEAAAWERLASFYAAVGNTERALASARTAVELWTVISDGVDVRTKSGRRRLALSMLRCGDINTEVRKLRDARDWYKKAAKEVESDSTDPLLGQVARQAAEQQVYLDAVEAGLVNPSEVLKFPKRVQLPALWTIIKLEVRADHPTTASLAVEEFAKLATTPGDKFATARGFAFCASASRGTKEAKDSYAADAVKYLKLAIDAGFRDSDALAAPEWDSVRKRVPEFAKVQEDLEKLVKDGK